MLSFGVGLIQTMLSRVMALAYWTDLNKAVVDISGGTCQEDVTSSAVGSWAGLKRDCTFLVRELYDTMEG
jgi:hypothetical protein